MHVETFAASYRPLEWLIFALGSILLALHWGDVGIAGLKKRHSLGDRLQRLTPKEADTVRLLLKGTSVIAWSHEDRVIYLHHDGILKQLDVEVGNGLRSYVLEKDAEKVARSKVRAGLIDGAE